MHGVVHVVDDERRQHRARLWGDLAWVAGLAGALIVCLLVLAWPVL